MLEHVDLKQQRSQRFNRRSQGDVDRRESPNERGKLARVRVAARLRQADYLAMLDEVASDLPALQRRIVLGSDAPAGAMSWDDLRELSHDILVAEDMRRRVEDECPEALILPPPQECEPCPPTDADGRRVLRERRDLLLQVRPRLLALHRLQKDAAAAKLRPQDLDASQYYHLLFDERQEPCHLRVERMPDDACRIAYDCKGCGEGLVPRAGDCCVFCSYGTTPCPPIQRERMARQALP